jgi:hypothetical protein
MDLKSFLLKRALIQSRMENKRTGPSSSASSGISRGIMMALLPLVFSALKNVLTLRKKSLIRTILLALGFRFLSPLLARSLWGFFFRPRATITF